MSGGGGFSGAASSEGRFSGGVFSEGAFPPGKWGFVPRSEIETRIARFQGALAQAGIGLALIIQGVDSFYLSGTLQQGQLLVPAQGDPILLVRKDPHRARAESAIRDIRAVASLRELPAVLGELGVGPDTVVGMELDVVPVNIFRRYETLFPAGSIRDCSPVIRQVRSVKSDYERGLIAEAAEIVDRGFRAAVDALRPGMTELELSAVCEAAMREVGNSNVRMRQFNEDWPFGNVGAGPDAALAGYTGNPLAGAGASPAVGQGSGWRRIGPGEPVVVDLVSFAGGYLCDQTRIISLGPLPDDLAAAHRLCLGVQDVVKEAARVGAVCGDVYKQANEWMTERLADAGLTAYFMGAPNNQAPYVGHGVGLELDESPVLARGFKTVLEQDQVIACEPKLVFPGRGVVGVENTWRVTDEGLERLTVSPDGLVEV
jgi:Xaa-Pro dipeptidase